MYLDFHTHGKLAKKLPFSAEYTHWLFSEAQKAGLDALCLTEHFNTLGFEELYQYISGHSRHQGDALIFEGLKIFPGMETDIREGGHILCFGPLGAILELNRRLEPHKEKTEFLPFKELMDLFAQYPVIVGGGHPFREGGHIPELPGEELARLHFLDLNGKDIAADRDKTERLTRQLGEKYKIPVVGGSDTHQAIQYGCIRTHFFRDCCTAEELYEEITAGRYRIEASASAPLQVRAAGILKRALKEIHAIGGDYVKILKEEAEA